MEGKSFCPYCMSHLGEGMVCPACGLTKGSYQPSPHHLPPGTILQGRYLIGRVLGEGGFGITYIGCDLRLEMKAAIKEYFPSDHVSRLAETSLAVVTNTSGGAYQGAKEGGVKTEREYEKGLKRFLVEARTMARMEKQPEIVMVRDFFEANNTAYIVMEYVEGTTFGELVEQKGGGIPPEELFRVLEPLFGALGNVHKRGLLHRDISPDNLMIEQGKIRLLDFGCAREASTGNETLTIALKQGYGPIEQYQEKGQGPWTDVYALSATIYFCLTGKKPPQAVDRMLEDKLVPPRELGVDITPEQQKALLKGMAVNPKLRYQSVEELHTGLYTVMPEQQKTALTQEASEAVESTDEESPAAGEWESPVSADDCEAEQHAGIENRTTDRTKLRFAIGGIAAMLAVVLLVVGIVMNVSSARDMSEEVVFREPVIEEAVRLMLDLPEGAITYRDLKKMSAIYIRADKIYESRESYDEDFALSELGTVTDLSDLANMPNLHEVCICGELITDLSPLEDLQYLQSIDLSRNDGIEDLSALSGKEMLTEACFWSCGSLEDIQAVSTWTQIASLNLSQTGNLWDVSDLGQLKDLESLAIVNCGNENMYQYLDGLEVVYLEIGENGQTDLECMKYIADVWELTCEGITDISALEGREDIHILTVTQCSISDFSPLFSMPNLSTVYISAGQQSKMNQAVLNCGEPDFEIIYQ